MQTAAVIVVTKRVASIGLKFRYYKMPSSGAVKRELKIKVLYRFLNHSDVIFM